MNRLIEVGKIKTYKSNEIKESKLGIGLEKLDRNVFDPSKTYDKLQELGIKRVRLQSGWMRTEQVEGIYDFAWLDKIVDNLIVRGMKPWLCLCYGNPLYTESAKEVFGAVGCPPINTEREKEGWRNYCKAVAVHYAGRINEFEVWNEPDGEWCWKHGANGTEYGEFVVETSKAVKSAQPNARVFGGSFCCRAKLDWLEAAFHAGMGEHIDGFTYHDYCEKETREPETTKVLRTIIDKYNSNITLIQGETGCPSYSEGHGALCEGYWTEDNQAKLLLRRILVELTLGLEFISWFTTVDMIEALNGSTSDVASILDYGYFGVLGAQFNENGYSIGEYKCKPSYYALQNICALFSDAEAKDIPVMIHWNLYSRRAFARTEEWDDLCTASFVKKNGSAAYAYWKPTNVLTTSYTGFTTFFASMPIEKLLLTDLLTGKVYKIPGKMIEDKGNGVYKLIEVPVKDHPLLLTFGDFFEVEEK